ncbi:sugar transferase [Pseudoalteromonas sp.]|uniref:sugar transferase n=1 Tax=Pseudoalteromonas sp. TaxID=53249 RepID=UPI00356351C7
MKKDHPFHFDSGYVAKQGITNTLFNKFAAIVLLFFSLPVFIVIPIIIRLQDGGPAFYAGARLGRHKKEFTMYKFRTLAVNAEQMIGSSLVSTSSLKLETPIGKFLRETRIDELPQLINVLMGDMDIIGPRPERQTVYDEMCKQIPWYDKRFSVKPGVIGYSQLFTPHSASKKTRALIDNFYLKRSHEVTSDIVLLSYALSVLVYKLVRKLPRAFAKTVKHFSPAYHKKQERRDSDRVNCHYTKINLWYKHPEEVDHEHLTMHMSDLQGEVVNINETDVYISLPSEIMHDIAAIELITRYRPLLQSKVRHKTVHCKSKLRFKREQNSQYPDQFMYVISMHELSPLNQLKLHKYFLHKSIS